MGWKKDFLYGTEDIATFFRGKRDAFFVVKENTQITGSLGLKELENGKGLLKRFYLDKNCRGRGVAQDLLKKAVEFAREKSYETLVLDTQADNLRAQRFYEKSGFVPFNPEPNQKWPESLHPDIFVYRMLKLS
jgi:ribosomal protein S18 acetylase RimI-like enzyme